MKLHRISIAAAILAVIAMTGCRQEVQTGKLSGSSSLTASLPANSSDAESTTTAVNEPTTSEKGSESLTGTSSEICSQNFTHQSSAEMSSKSSSSIRSESSRISSVAKPPVNSSDTSFTGKVSSIPESSKPEPPSSKPELPSSKPEPPEEKDPYAYPFDIEGIKKDLIKYGESIGMKHRTHYPDGREVTPYEGCSYELPLYIKKGFPSNIMKRRLYEQLDSYRNVYKADIFTIYIESFGNSEYKIYSIYA